MQDSAMRRIGVISDVHGNLGALVDALAAAAEEECAEVWCLGDTFSGAGAFDCFEPVQKHCTRTLLGNHEEMVLEVDLDPSFQPEDDSPIGLAAAQLRDRPDLRPLLMDLRPLERISTPGGEIVLAHGSPHRPTWHWVKSAEDVDLAFAAIPSAHVLLVGHTHVAALGAPANGRGSDALYRVGRPLLDGIELGEHKLLLNPGALSELPLGVPASWGMLTLDDDGRPTRFDWRYL